MVGKEMQKRMPLVDIGGEDSKMIFFEPGRVPDMRMNGNCAGGTGAKNCLYKVLKLQSFDQLGEHIMVQGGTFRNHSVVRALEILTGKDVQFSPIPELMGAYGCALYALRRKGGTL